jgi:hypothetical protein
VGLLHHETIRRKSFRHSAKNVSRGCDNSTRSTQLRCDDTVRRYPVENALQCDVRCASISDILTPSRRAGTSSPSAADRPSAPLGAIRSAWRAISSTDRPGLCGPATVAVCLRDGCKGPRPTPRGRHGNGVQLRPGDDHAPGHRGVRPVRQRRRAGRLRHQHRLLRTMSFPAGWGRLFVGWV